jgi:hypothetical protein
MSHNRNPLGRNQHGPVCKCLIFIHCEYGINASILVKADDSTLHPALEKYHREGLTNDKKISERLMREYDIDMKCVTIALFCFV